MMDNSQACAETNGVLSGVAGVILSCNPISGFMWNVWKDQQDAKWKYRVKEFMRYISSGDFSADLFKSESSQDGLALSFRAFIQQRNKQKRKYIKSIFFEFIKSGAEEDFELERNFDVVEKISKEQTEILRNLYITGTVLLVSENTFQKEVDTVYYSNSKYLESLGLVYIEFYSEVRMEEEYEADYEGGVVASTHLTGRDIARLETSETLVLSDFGKEFIQYIQE